MVPLRQSYRCPPPPSGKPSQLHKFYPFFHCDLSPVTLLCATVANCHSCNPAPPSYHVLCSSACLPQATATTAAASAAPAATPTAAAAAVLTNGRTPAPLGSIFQPSTPDLLSSISGSYKSYSKFRSNNISQPPSHLLDTPTAPSF